MKSNIYTSQKCICNHCNDDICNFTSILKIYTIHFEWLVQNCICFHLIHFVVEIQFRLEDQLRIRFNKRSVCCVRWGCTRHLQSICNPTVLYDHNYVQLVDFDRNFHKYSQYHKISFRLSSLFRSFDEQSLEYHWIYR